MNKNIIKLAHFLITNKLKKEYEYLLKLAAAGEGFEHWFEGKERIFIPYSLDDKDQIDKKLKEKYSILLNILKDHFQIKDEDINLANKKIRTKTNGVELLRSLNGKFFTKFIFEKINNNSFVNNISDEHFKDGRQNFLKIIKNSIGKSSFFYDLLNIFLENIIDLKINYSNFEYEIRKLYNEIIEIYDSSFDFLNDYSYSTKTNKLIAISRNEDDIRNMSTGRRWTSCTSIGNMHYSSAVCESKSGGFIAYLIDEDDKEIQKPHARILIRKFTSKDRLINIAIPEDTTQGMKDEIFRERVNDWIESKQGNITFGKYYRQGGDQSDTYDEEEEFGSENQESEETYIDFALNSKNINNMISKDKVYFFVKDILPDDYKSEVPSFENAKLFYSKEDAQKEIDKIKNTINLEYMLLSEKRKEVIDSEEFGHIIDEGGVEGYSEYQQALYKREYPDDGSISDDEFNDVILEVYNNLYYEIKYNDDEDLIERFRELSELNDFEQEAINIYNNKNKRFKIEEVYGSDIIDNPKYYMEDMFSKTKSYLKRQMHIGNKNLPWSKIFENNQELKTHRNAQILFRSNPELEIDESLKILKDVKEKFNPPTNLFTDNYFQYIPDIKFVKEMKNISSKNLRVKQPVSELLKLMSESFNLSTKILFDLINKLNKKIQNVFYNYEENNEAIKIDDYDYDFLKNTAKIISKKMGYLENSYRDEYIKVLQIEDLNLNTLKNISDGMSNLNKNISDFSKRHNFKENRDLERLILYLNSDISYALKQFDKFVVYGFEDRDSSLGDYISKNFNLKIGKILYLMYDQKGNLNYNALYADFNNTSSFYLESILDNPRILNEIKKHKSSIYDQMLIEKSTVKDSIIDRKNIIEKLKTYKNNNMMKEFYNEDFQKELYDSIEDIVKMDDFDDEEVGLEFKERVPKFNFFRITEIIKYVKRSQKYHLKNFNFIYYNYIPMLNKIMSDE